MRNHDHRTPDDQAIHRAHHLDLSLDIQGGRGFVQYQDGSVAQDGARYSQPYSRWPPEKFLPCSRTSVSYPSGRLIIVWCMSLFRSSNNVSIAGAWSPNLDVFRDRALRRARPVRPYSRYHVISRAGTDGYQHRVDYETLLDLVEAWRSA